MIARTSLVVGGGSDQWDGRVQSQRQRPVPAPARVRQSEAPAPAAGQPGGAAAASDDDSARPAGREPIPAQQPVESSRVSLQGPVRLPGQCNYDHRSQNPHEGAARETAMFVCCCDMVFDYHKS
eukprot:COSAG01_NODE_58_length_30193_cov_12.302020_13_plen_124_part_00